jgi:LacI family transcriptional regulator
MATIRDVARLAGVAPITVSRVINNAGYISEQTRARVEQVIHELHYVPNTLARSLRSRHTNTLGLVLTDITNPFWTTVARGVEDAASDAGFNVILCKTDESKFEQEKYLHVLLEKRVDGVLLVPVGCEPDPVEFVQSQKVPIVVIDRWLADMHADSVRCDSEDGGYQLTHMLLELGHRQIAMFSGPAEISTAHDRVSGYRRGLGEVDLSSHDEKVYYGEFTQESGAAMARLALSDLPQPTAIVANNNFIALGAYQAIREAGYRVPEDISMVGFDDLPTGLLLEPFFTVVVQPAYEMGRQATELLLARIAGQASPGFQEIILPVSVVVHHSSASPRPAATSDPLRPVTLVQTPN